MRFELDRTQQAAGVADIWHHLGSDDYTVTCLGPDGQRVGYLVSAPAADDVSLTFEPHTVATVVITPGPVSSVDAESSGTSDTFTAC